MQKTAQRQTDLQARHILYQAGLIGWERVVAIPTAAVKRGDLLRLRAKLKNLSTQAGVNIDAAFAFRLNLGHRTWVGTWETTQFWNFAAMVFTPAQEREIDFNFDIPAALDLGTHGLQLVVYVNSISAANELGWFEDRDCLSVAAAVAVYDMQWVSGNIYAR